MDVLSFVMVGAGGCLPLALAPCQQHLSGFHGPAHVGGEGLPRTVRAEPPGLCCILLAIHPSKELCRLCHCRLFSLAASATRVL